MVMKISSQKMKLQFVLHLGPCIFPPNLNPLFLIIGFWIFAIINSKSNFCVKFLYRITSNSVLWSPTLLDNLQYILEVGYCIHKFDKSLPCFRFNIHPAMAMSFDDTCLQNLHGEGGSTLWSSNWSKWWWRWQPTCWCTGNRGPRWMKLLPLGVTDLMEGPSTISNEGHLDTGKVPSSLGKYNDSSNSSLSHTSNGLTWNKINNEGSEQWADWQASRGFSLLSAKLLFLY